MTCRIVQLPCPECGHEQKDAVLVHNDLNRFKEIPVDCEECGTEFNKPIEPASSVGKGERSLFEGTIDTIDAAVERKRAAAHPDRFEALVYAYEHRDEEPLRVDSFPADIEAIRPLLEANLLAGYPGPSGEWYVHITTLGKLELPIGERVRAPLRGEDR